MGMLNEFSIYVLIFTYQLMLGGLPHEATEVQMSFESFNTRPVRGTLTTIKLGMASDSFKINNKLSECVEVFSSICFYAGLKSYL